MAGRPIGKMDVMGLLSLLLLLAISLPALTLRLGVYPPMWFDEGYRTNAARTLAERGVYGTYTAAGYQPFDPGVSSGPMDIVPIALSFRLFGTGAVEARVVIVLFALLALFSLYRVLVFIYGYPAALFATLVWLAFPAIHGIGFLLIGRQVLGEVPALAMIALGLWLWFRFWGSRRWALAVLAGLAFGFGLLSKMQVGIAFLPALVLIAVGRGLRDRSQLLRLLAPIAIAVAIMAGWTLLGTLATPEQIRQENDHMLTDAVKTYLLTGLFGRQLNTDALVILALMGVSVLACVWRLRGQVLRAGRADDRDWAEATLALFVLGSALWYAFLSVGWPRYAFAGLVAAQLLVGRLGWDVFESVRRWGKRRWPWLGRHAYTVTIAGLALVAVLVNVYPIVQFDQDYKAQQMADYIGATVPRDAVVESWAWELDALGPHWEYHHPHQDYLTLAVRQVSHERKPFDLDYDLLQADPDYLVAGPFSDWTNIYEPEPVEANFVELAEIGVYRIYRRVH